MTEQNRQKLEKFLKPGTRIPHWCADGNDRIGGFTIATVDSDRIWIKDPERYIYYREFARVLKVWPDYCNQIIPRWKLAELTSNSTYVISIIHWLESK